MEYNYFRQHRNNLVFLENIAIKRGIKQKDSPYCNCIIKYRKDSKHINMFCKHCNRNYKIKISDCLKNNKGAYQDGGHLICIGKDIVSAKCVFCKMSTRSKAIRQKIKDSLGV